MVMGVCVCVFGLFWLWSHVDFTYIWYVWFWFCLHLRLQYDFSRHIFKLIRFMYGKFVHPFCWTHTHRDLLLSHSVSLPLSVRARVCVYVFNVYTRVHIKFIKLIAWGSWQLIAISRAKASEWMINRYTSFSIAKDVYPFNVFFLL